MGAEQGPGLGVEHRLDEAVGLARGDVLAVVLERVAADLDVEALGLGGGLGQAHRSNLGGRIGAARHGRVQVVRLQAGDVLQAVNALVAGLVRQPGRPGHVADGVQARHAGGEVLIGHDVGLLDLHAEGLQAHVLDVAHDADGHDGHVALERLGLAAGLDIHRYARSVLGQLLDGGADAELQPPPLEHLLGGGRDLLVLHRQDAVHGLDHRHVRAQGAEEAGELDADGARADHQQGLRRGLRNQGLTIGPHLVAVRLHADGRDGAGARAGGQDHVLGLHGALTAGLEVDDDLRRRAALLELGRAFDHLDLVLLHQEGDAAVQLL